MTELTPERIRDAGEVLREYSRRVKGDPEAGDYSWSGAEMDAWADMLEREQATEAKRESRIEQLTDEIVTIFNARGKWPDVARVMLDRYPALAEQPTCGHPNHGNNDHDCAPFLDYQARNAR